MLSSCFRSRTPIRPRVVSHALLLMIGLLMIGLLVAPPIAVGAAVPPTVLGTAQGFLVLGGSTVTNTGTTTVAGGSLGVSPGTAVVGFPPGIVVAPGAIHAADAVAAQAQSDVTTAYNVLAGQARTATLTGQDLGGKTLTTGVYFFAAAAQLTGQLTLDAKGDASAVFVFQIGSTLTTASNASVLLVNGASPCNVYWQVGSSATLGTGTSFVGNILAFASIALNTGASVSGRALARNGATTLNTNTFSSGGCGASAPPTVIPATATVIPATVTVMPAPATRTPGTVIPPTGTVVIPATGTPVVSTGTVAPPIPATGTPVVSTGTPTILIPATGTPVAPTAIPVVQIQNNATPAIARPNTPQSALATPIIIGPVISGPNRNVPFYTGVSTDTSAPSSSVAAAIPATAIPATATVISRTLALVGSSAGTASTTGVVASTATAPPIPVSLPNTGGGGMATHFTATAANVTDHDTSGVLWIVITALVALTGAGLLRIRQVRR